jgi:hypothetical protein
MKQSYIIALITALGLAGCGQTPDTGWNKDCERYSINSRELKECKARVESEAQQVPAGSLGLDPTPNHEIFEEGGNRQRDGQPTQTP